MAGRKLMSEANDAPTNESPENETQSSPPWAAIATIIAAIITCTSAVIVAALNPDLAEIVLNKNPTPTYTIIATETLTQPPATNTPPIISNPADTPTSSLFAGQDWQADCISIELWQPFLEGDSAEDYEGCYDLVPWGIAANNGNLLLTATSNQTISAMEYGIFTPLSQNKEFQFSIQIKTLDNSEVWMGFFDQSSLQSEGILVAIQPDDNFDVREMPSQVEFAENIHLFSEEGNFENILVEFVGSSIYVTVDGQPVVAGYPINVSPKHLFLGYRMLSKGEIKATVRSMEIR